MSGGIHVSLIRRLWKTESTIVTLVCHRNKSSLASKERLPAPQPTIFFQLLPFSWSGLIQGYSSYTVWPTLSQPVIAGDCDYVRSRRRCTQTRNRRFWITPPMLNCRDKPSIHAAYTVRCGTPSAAHIFNTTHLCPLRNISDSSKQRLPAVPRLGSPTSDCKLIKLYP